MTSESTPSGPDGDSRLPEIKVGSTTETQNNQISQRIEMANFIEINDDTVKSHQDRQEFTDEAHMSH